MNTGFLYGKMLITMFISLYSTRLILSALGVDDFGVFNLVSGVIGMLTFLNGAMAVSTQRYLSYHLGAGEMSRLKSVFNTSVLIHLIIGTVVVLALEIAGFFLFRGGLNIPEDRIFAAKWIYQFMIISTFFTINAVPYDATINAHENMLFDAITGIFEAVVKLGIAFLILYTLVDKLILYGVLIASLTILIRVIKSIYCIRKYEECKIRQKPDRDKVLFREMFSFGGWNLFGAFCNVAKNQGLAIILNLFIGVVANAAFGIANQVNSQLAAFSANIIKAMNPQIVKSEGAGDRSRMLWLAMLACKFSFFLLAFFAVPLIIEMHYILNIWLESVPEYAVIFCQLILIMSLFQQITWGLMVAVQSVGRIKLYQFVVGSLLILNLPLSVAALKMGFPAYSVLIVSILLELTAGGARVFFARRLTGLDPRVFLGNIVFKSFLTIGLAAAFALIPGFFMKEGFLRLVVTVLVSSGFILLIARYIGMTKDEVERIRDMALSLLRGLLNRVSKKARVRA
ncbi:MAG: hypothetical protein ACOYXB_09820 [Bacteroidota bacterium]